MASSPVPEPSDTDALLTTEEVAARLRLSLYTVRKWLRQGTLHGFRAGKGWRVRESDLRRFEDQQRAQTP